MSDLKNKMLGAFTWSSIDRVVQQGVQFLIGIVLARLLSPTDYEDSEPISPEESAEERIMLGLRTDVGARVPEDKYHVAERIASLGYGKFENGILVLNSKGFRVSNEIISEILV